MFDAIESGKFNRKILLYGGSSAGKTTLAGTAQDVPELANMLVLSLDGGFKTLEGKKGVLKVSKILENAANVEEVLWAFAQKSAEVAGIHTILIDGLSELQKRDLAGIAEEAAEAKDARNEDVNELGDYRVNKSRILRLVRMARDLPDVTVIFTAWDLIEYPMVPNKQGKMEPNKAAPAIKIRPDFTESLWKAMQGFFDEIWYIKQDKGRRLLYTDKYDIIEARTRGTDYAKNLCTEKNGQAFPILESPNFVDIFAAYKKAQGDSK